MKRGFLFLLILFVFWGCQHPFSRTPQSEKAKPIHVVFDIDWTIVSNFEEGVSKVPASKILSVEDKKYIPREYLVDLIENLLNEGMIISFYSGGSKSRNETLLKMIKLSNGKSLFDIAYKIKNFEDLYRVPGTVDTDSFTTKYKKDLLKISDDLDQIVLVDDMKNFFKGKEQEANMLFLGPTYKYFETYQEAKLFQGEYRPNSVEEFNFDKSRFKLVNEILIDAKNSSESEGISFRDAVVDLSKKIDLESGHFNEFSLQALKKVNAKSLPLSKNCSKLISPFFVIK